MSEQAQNSRQIEVLDNIYYNIIKGLEMGKTLISLQGSSRCFAARTKVRMADGRLKNVEDIVVGDKVMSADGVGYNTVVETHKGTDMMYQVEQDNGCTYIVNSRHLIVVHKCNSPITQTCTAEYLYHASRLEQKLLRGSRKVGDSWIDTILTIDKFGIGQFYGFSLDNDPHFLLEDGTLVHNSGKTRNTIIWLIMEALKQPVKISVVRKSLPAIRRTVLEDFKIVMIQMGQWEDKRMNKTELVYNFRNGSVFEFFSADDEQKLRGSTRDILFCNEANELEEVEFKQLRMRTRKYVIIDYNPSFTEEHWIFPLRMDKRTYHFVSTFRDNIFLEPAIVEEIESYKETNKALWQIYGMGEFAIIEGLVFPKENWDIIPDTEFPDWKSEGFGGLDWGMVNDPTVFVHAIIDGNDIYVREIFRETGLKTTDIAERLEDWKDITKYCDIDHRLVADLEDAGIPMLIMTEKDQNSILTGIRIMNQRKIHITESSTELIKEFRNYVYKKDRHEVYQTKLKPIDKFNHGIDALRYICYNEYLTEIDNDYGISGRQLTKYDLGFVI